jgi:adenine-specific DNA-methyltransferase
MNRKQPEPKRSSNRWRAASRVFTPAPLAEALVASLAAGPTDTWLDPCVGEGAFVNAMLNHGTAPNAIVGIDLVRTRPAVHRQVRLETGIDFIDWAESTNQRFTRVIANPPFVGLRRLPPALRRRALSVEIGGKRPARLSGNYWVAFLIQSLKLLARGGHLAFVLPASWEYADYAAGIRETVPSEFERFDIHRSLTPLFPGVQEGAIVLIGRGRGFPHRDRRYFEHRSPYDLCLALTDPDCAPTSVTIGGTDNHAVAGDDWVPLGQVMHVTIGAVTGDARYFLLTEKRRRDLSLPTGAMRPALTHARQLTSAVIDQQLWRRLRDSGERVWLFRARERFLKHWAVHDYLQLAAEKGGCNRGAYKVASRVPWHRSRLPVRPDGFMSGMSRLGPWIALSGIEQLTASNTLYCVRFRSPLSNDAKAAWALSLLTTTARRQLLPLGRRYPDGLLKFEPSDLNRVLLLRPGKIAGAEQAYRLAVKHLLSGSAAEAQSVADGWMENSRPDALSEGHPHCIPLERAG